MKVDDDYKKKLLFVLKEKKKAENKLLKLEDVSKKPLMSVNDRVNLARSHGLNVRSFEYNEKKNKRK